jgi:hypothetical protein
MKQTAVEWLAEQITTVKWRMSDVTDRNSIIEQAKEMEMKQIMDAYIKGHIESSWGRFADSEQYYNKTYKSE